MSHDGRMARGKENFNSGKLLDNADTLYYLANKVEEKPKAKPKKEIKEEVKDEQSN